MKLSRRGLFGFAAGAAAAAQMKPTIAAPAPAAGPIYDKMRLEMIEKLVRPLCVLHADGTTTIMRTSIPQGYWRLYNQGVPLPRKL